MHSVAQVSEPGIDTFAVDFLDARIVVARRGSLSTDADPVHIAGILKRDLDSLVVLHVVEFVGVFVGKEEKVRANTFCHGHGTGDWTDTGAHGGEKAAFDAVDNLVEFGELIVKRSRLIPLLGDGRISLGVDLLFREWLDHFVDVMGCKVELDDDSYRLLENSVVGILKYV